MVVQAVLATGPLVDPELPLLFFLMPTILSHMPTTPWSVPFMLRVQRAVHAGAIRTGGKYVYQVA